MHEKAKDLVGAYLRRQLGRRGHLAGDSGL